jgi:hypothetical protein
MLAETHASLVPLGWRAPFRTVGGSAHCLSTLLLSRELHSADWLIDLPGRERRQEETMSEVTTPTFANIGISRKYRPNPASTEDSNSKLELDRRLDEALKDTFPASDAISLVIPVR